MDILHGIDSIKCKNKMEVLENLYYLDNQSILSQLVQITLTAEHKKV